jgi:hypothetical protein
MGPPAKKGDHKYTCADYQNWPDELSAFPDLELQLWEVFGKELPQREENREP